MKHSEMDFRYTMTFSQCVHGMYDEKMEAVYRKCSQNASFEEDSESTLLHEGGYPNGKRQNFPLQRPVRTLP